MGQFINHNKAFRRYDRSVASKDTNSYKASGRRGDSLKIDEPMHGPGQVELGMMSRFVNGERYAVAAVKGWKFNPRRVTKVPSSNARKGVARKPEHNGAELPAHKLPATALATPVQPLQK